MDKAQKLFPIMISTEIFPQHQMHSSQEWALLRRCRYHCLNSSVEWNENTSPGHPPRGVLLCSTACPSCPSLVSWALSVSIDHSGSYLSLLSLHCYIGVLSFQHLSEGCYIFHIPQNSWYMEDTHKSLEKKRKVRDKKRGGGWKEKEVWISVKNNMQPVRKKSIGSWNNYLAMKANA